MNKLTPILIIIIILLSFFLYKEYNKPTETITVEVPFEVEVKVPVYVGDTTIVKPIYKVVKGVDSLYFKEYLALKDSIQRDSMVKDALTIREYNEQLDDENVTIDVYSNVTGKLNNQKINYTTKEKTIKIDTIIKKEIIVPYKNRFGVGLETGFLDGMIVNKVNASYNMKKLDFSVGADTDWRYWVGFKYKF